MTLNPTGKASATQEIRERLPILADLPTNAFVIAVVKLHLNERAGPCQAFELGHAAAS